ncbi:PLDc N-terminal domain-containing protein [Luteolibacter marinus]|uniref:PLDc N-terminal domain-containing protein n=1 Tax=Luteolibacter marinus TaxID=2776705 RepID=UPI001867487E|nr:PLDc N-terminal domain-containing protein [Luteolibacter marinus]
MKYLSFIGGLGGQELIVIFFVLLPMLLCLIALIQCLKAEFAQATDRLVWVIVLLFLPILGPILWWTIGIGKTIR